MRLTTMVAAAALAVLALAACGSQSLASAQPNNVKVCRLIQGDLSWVTHDQTGMAYLSSVDGQDAQPGTALAHVLAGVGSFSLSPWPARLGRIQAACRALGVHVG